MRKDERPASERPASLNEEDALRLQAEHSQSKDVSQAHIYEFAGVRRVQLDLKDGDIVVLNGKEALHIEW